MTIIALQRQRLGSLGDDCGHNGHVHGEDAAAKAIMAVIANDPYPHHHKDPGAAPLQVVFIVSVV